LNPTILHYFTGKEIIYAKKENDHENFKLSVESKLLKLEFKNIALFYRKNVVYAKKKMMMGTSNVR